LFSKKAESKSNVPAPFQELLEAFIKDMNTLVEENGDE